MTKTFNWTDKLIAVLTLLSGLSISAVAVYYSVAGLVAIFAASVIPIIVMGVALEVSKLVATLWLKQNWSIAPRFIKIYLTTAVVVLMIITSMGIFGFLSKAHSDQSLVSGDVQSKIALYDEKINTSKENIEANRRALKQMDEAVDQVMARSDSERGAERAVQIRRNQQKERARLQNEIAQEQKNIAQLNDQAAPIRAEIRKVEAEVGPLKYIAAFIYGDSPDANLLEKAVTWVIIIIVAVFDPLAVILLLASQHSFGWFRQQREEAEKEINEPVQADPSQPKPVVTSPGATLVEPTTTRYPDSDPDIEELMLALEEATRKDVDNVSVDSRADVQDMARHDDSNDEPVRVDAPVAEEIKPKRTRQVKEVAPPGTPGEEWAVADDKSEQPVEDNLDKIYKASTEDLAKKIRSRGWFQATFPKKDNI